MGCQLWYEESVKLSELEDYNAALIAINKAVELNQNFSDALQKKAYGYLEK